MFRVQNKVKDDSVLSNFILLNIGYGISLPKRLSCKAIAGKLHFFWGFVASGCCFCYLSTEQHASDMFFPIQSKNKEGGGRNPSSVLAPVR